MTLFEFLGDHTYRTVLIGCVLMGIVAGALGSVAYVRRQSLASDVVSHAALPGILTAFIAGSLMGLDPRSNQLLIGGAAVAGVFAMVATRAIERTTRLGADAAMAVTLVTFFGAGMVLLAVVQRGNFPAKGGIHHVLFGNASVLTTKDVTTVAAVSVLVLASATIAWRATTLRSFDPDFAAVVGVHGKAADALIYAAYVLAVVVGVKAVGVVLMVAFLISPAVAARPWVSSMRSFAVLSSIVGGVSSAVGAWVSIAWWNVATGPAIVVTLALAVMISLLSAPRTGIVSRAVRRSRARRHLESRLSEVGRS